MKNSLFELRSLLLLSFLFISCINIHAQSLKGFTLGEQPPIVNGKYLTKKSTTVSGVSGTVGVTIFHKNFDAQDFYNSEIAIEAKDDLTRLTAVDYNSKYGVPIVKSIYFSPDYSIKENRGKKDEPFYPEVYENSFVQNVSDYYSIKLEPYYWAGTKSLKEFKGMKAKISISISGDYGLILSDEFLSSYHWNSKKDIKAKDF